MQRGTYKLGKGTSASYPSQRHFYDWMHGATFEEIASGRRKISLHEAGWIAEKTFPPELQRFIGEAFTDGSW